MGLKIDRRYTSPKVSVLDSVDWELRDAAITNTDGSVVFEQKDVEVPAFWSQMATNVVVSKYFRGPMGTPQRETSVRQVISRVVGTIASWGRNAGYFDNEQKAEAFSEELKYLLVHQYGSFNSPVWFNIGVSGVAQQASACFIQRVEDDLTSITDLMASEAKLFKFGSGCGTNMSRLRSTMEKLALGGQASGPVSFMKALDSIGGAMKSGGTTRRAAIMRVLDVTHPDIMDFITCKKDAEQKAWALIDAGYEGSFNVERGAYDTVPFQNANHSVRVTDEFMQAFIDEETFTTKLVLTGEPAGRHAAVNIMREIADATYVCGDPGMQYDDTINKWHTCKNTDRIYASNPCSEYMFLDDTACNLASLNLLKFRKTECFDAADFIHACRVFITAMEILVGHADYPTESITKNSHIFRTLGLGFCNLGALLMAEGMAYDSDSGRRLAAYISAIMTGAAYSQSARISGLLGPFDAFPENREPMLEVMNMHRDATYNVGVKNDMDSYLKKFATDIWDEAISLGEKCGFRNAQATVLAPTGTIAFMMDADTTGIEPDLALVKFKRLVGGGTLKIVNQTVPLALKRLGYEDPQIEDIIHWISNNDTIEGSPHLLPKHLSIFDCAFKPQNGERSIHYMGHVKMMEACQPFISGAISKTVNLPTDCTVEDIMDAYVEGWKGGLKAIAIYRDGSKRTQPLSTTDSTSSQKDEAETDMTKVPLYHPYRKKLTRERDAIVHKFSVAGQEGYLVVGLYEDGRPGELFINMSKEGSTVSGLMDCFAISISIGLQYGVPLRTLVNKFKHTRFEPAGFTGNPDIPSAMSLLDYIFTWLDKKFLGPDSIITEFHQTGTDEYLDGLEKLKESMAEQNEAAADWKHIDNLKDYMGSVPSDAPFCSVCDTQMVRAGACYRCPNCGTTTGCG